MAKKQPMGQWKILAVGTLVALCYPFNRSRGFRRGKIVGLHGDEDTATRYGGIYDVVPIDGPDTDTPQRLPRSSFVPVSTGRAKRRVTR